MITIVHSTCIVSLAAVQFFYLYQLPFKLPVVEVIQRQMHTYAFHQSIHSEWYEIVKTRRCTLSQKIIFLHIRSSNRLICIIHACGRKHKIKERKRNNWSGSNELVKKKMLTPTDIGLHRMQNMHVVHHVSGWSINWVYSMYQRWVFLLSCFPHFACLSSLLFNLQRAKYAHVELF